MKNPVVSLTRLVKGSMCNATGIEDGRYIRGWFL